MKPPSTSTLSMAKLKKCSAWLAAHGIDACPLCRAKRLVVRDVVTARVMDVETSTPQAHGMLFAAVECGNCLHVLLFDAVKIGLVGKGDPGPAQ